MGANAPPTTRQIAEAVLLDERRRRELFAYAQSRFGIRGDDAEDLLQDTVIELLRCRGVVRSAEGFVFAVFRARCARFVAGRIAAHVVFSETTTAAIPDAAEPLSSERTDGHFALGEALNRISLPCRRLLEAYYVEGQTLREAANTGSLAYSSVAKTISRCLRRLRRCLS